METAEELSAREGYAAWARWYDGDGNPLVALEGPALRGWFGELEGRRALDLGCGTGRHALAMAEAGARLVGLDQSPEMLGEAARKGSGVALVRAALPGPLPFRDGTFDLVVMGLVAEHVAGLADLMREVARVLVPGGRGLLSALHPERTAEGQRARFIDPETGLRRPIATYHRTAEEYRAAAEGAGLAVIEERTLVVPPELGERLPRASRYVGKPLGWVAKLGR